jgi:superfamily I DNA/RNA helicase
VIEPEIFLGPPGTGKTTKLLDVVLHELEHGVPPDRIGYMTFTRKGVEEAISRAARQFNRPRKEFRYFNTLHSAAFRHLGLNTTQVFKGDRIREFCEANPQYGIKTSGFYSPEDGTYTNFRGDDMALFLDNIARITGESIGSVLDRTQDIITDRSRVLKIINILRTYKEEQGLFDFTDMIEEFIKLDDPPRLEVLIIDEAQDLSNLQWRMVEQLARHVKRLYIAGDDDQTIFTWAGASERFITLPGKVQILEQSWRVPHVVHKLANNIVQSLSKRRDKLWLPRDEEGKIVAIDGVDNLNPKFIAEESSVMLLARTVKLVRQFFVPFCRNNGIPYQLFDAKAIKEKHANVIVAWNRLNAGEPVDVGAIAKVYETLPSDTHGITKGVARGAKTIMKSIADNEGMFLTMEELRKDYGLQAEGPWYEVFTEIPQEEMSFIKRVMAKGYDIREKPKVHISTIHRVKGGQANTVVLMSDQAEAIERATLENPDEEIRVFYTGVTRTFENLVVVQPTRRHYFGGLFE